MKSSDKKYLVKNTAIFALNSIGTKLVSFLLVPIYTKAFSAPEYGTIDIVTTIATIMVPLITLNIGEAVMRFALDENANKNNIASVGLFFGILSLLLGMCIFPVLDCFFPIVINKIDKKLIYVYCITQGWYQILVCNLRGKEKLLAYAISNMLNTFIAVLLSCTFLLILHIGLNGYFYAYIIAFLISGLYCIFVGDISHAVKNFCIDRYLLKNMIKYSVLLVPNSLMWWIMNSSDHVMVTAMISVTANGIYAVSYKIPSILSALSTVFSQAWSYSAIHENNSPNREQLNNNMYGKLVRFQLIVTLFLMCTIKPFLRIYVSEEYYEAWKYTPYLLVGTFFLTMATFLSTSYTVNKDSRGFLFSSIIGAAVNIVLNCLWIPTFGVSGAALATCISYICVFLYRVYDTKKYIVIHVLKSSYVIGYVLLALSALTILLPSKISGICLFIEFLLMLLINRTFIIECLCLIQNAFKHFQKANHERF